MSQSESSIDSTLTVPMAVNMEEPSDDDGNSVENVENTETVKVLVEELEFMIQRITDAFEINRQLYNMVIALYQSTGRV